METSKNDEQTKPSVESLLQLIETLVREVRPGFPAEQLITIDSTFDKDLGLDSLARVELISRVEDQFNLALPERTFAEAETARDLLRAVLGTSGPREILSATKFQPIELSKMAGAPVEAQTLLEVLDWHVSEHPDRIHIRIYQDQADDKGLSYLQLKNGAIKLASGLQSLGLRPAEPVAIMLPSGVDYFFSFFGILMAGGIPVPIYPPARASQLEDHIRRHVHILENCLANTLITVPEAKRVAQLLKLQAPSLGNIVSVTELTTATDVFTPPALNANDTAFIQYTSGSTGQPKGVVLTHQNLLANIRAMGQVVNANSNDVFVSWLPLYHDMGLIGAWLGSLYYAALFVVMPPLSFLSRPERWLWAIHRYGGTLSASPNFGYEYCLRRLKDEDLKGLNLGSWRAAFNGAESVSPETLCDFSERFKTYGFPPEAMMPVYGLAESTVGLAFPPINRGSVIDCIDRTVFMRTGNAKPVACEIKQALKFPSSGPPLPGHEIRIVDQASHELPERQEGRLQFRGPSSTSGYFRNAKKTRELFDESWLDSSDLAYIASGELYITGRIKDIIIRAGRNIYPHELEEAVGNIPAIRAGRVAVFGSKDKKSGTERLIVLAETRVKDAIQREELKTEINTLATDLIGSPPDDVVLAPANTVLKTSSGKIRRAASREIYEKGEIGKTNKSVLWQITRLSIASIMPQMQRSIRYGKAWLYAAYCWFVYGSLAPIVWLTATFSPSFKLRWSIMSACSRILAKATATPVVIHGLENLSIDKHPCVIIANHSSFLDSYSLVAKLPFSFRFIAKMELAQRFITRKPLENIGTVFVERYDTSKSARETQALIKLLNAGDTLMFFAEGTFSRVPGIGPFHLGAFNIAAEAGVPVIPIAIRGTRSILRADSWFPHHGAIHMEIGKPINPGDVMDENHKDIWSISIALRDKSREFILRHCGEPDLAQ